MDATITLTAIEIPRCPQIVSSRAASDRRNRVTNVLLEGWASQIFKVARRPRFAVLMMAVPLEPSGRAAHSTCSVFEARPWGDG